MRMRWPCVAALLFACAPGPQGNALQTADPDTPLTLELRRPDGEPLSLVRLRGEPVLLFLFATFDDASQLALTPLIELHRRHPGLRVIGIALQPEPGPLLRSYAAALDVDFELVSEPQGRLLSGDTPLGRQVTVPMFVAVDAAGRVVESFLGVPAGGELELLVQALPGAEAAH